MELFSEYESLASSSSETFEQRLRFCVAMKHKNDLTKSPSCEYLQFHEKMRLVYRLSLR